jgi:hypothetical protein
LNRGATLTLTNGTLLNNLADDSGGGIENIDEGTVILTNCTLSGNSALYGAGIENGGTLTLTNCTLASNSATIDGGGILSGSLNGSTVTLANTIIAGNTLTGSDGSGPDVDGGVNSMGYNLIGETDGSSGWVSSDLAGNIASPLDPLLALLRSYGGPTQTMALLPGSPAIDAGNHAFVTNPPFPGPPFTDQRGVARIINGTVDIGAFESQGFTIAVSSGSN